MTRTRANIPTSLETSRLVLCLFEERDWDDLHRVFEDESEAALAVQTMAFQTLKRDCLTSLIFPENEASKRVAIRLGGIYEKTITFRDGRAEVYVYSRRD
jgi:hypothetical protein